MLQHPVVLCSAGHLPQLNRWGAISPSSRSYTPRCIVARTLLTEEGTTCAIASPAGPAISPPSGAAACTSSRYSRECPSRSGAAATALRKAPPGACSRGCADARPSARDHHLRRREQRYKDPAYGARTLPRSLAQVAAPGCGTFGRALDSPPERRGYARSKQRPAAGSDRAGRPATTGTAQRYC